MAKDPAVLFYTSDFLTGTLTMTNDQVGKYIRLLCLQHQKGFLTEKDMLNICQSYDEDIFSKFIKDDTGKYYNERLESEISRRKSYSLSRSLNRKSTKHKPKRKKKHMSIICQSYDEHMETETEDENINKDEDKREGKGEIIYPWNDEKFMEAWQLWKQYKKEQHNFSYKPIGEQGALKDLSELSKNNMEIGIAIIYQSIKKGWKGFFELKNKQGEYVDYAQELIKSMTNGQNS
jgi:uncharacterized protein YdaU (DUF1376 family)